MITVLNPQLQLFKELIKNKVIVNLSSQKCKLMVLICSIPKLFKICRLLCYINKIQAFRVSNITHRTEEIQQPGKVWINNIIHLEGLLLLHNNNSH